MKGFKVFNSNFTCMGFQYEVGQTYEMEGIPELCERGFHFCEKAVDCFNFYDFNTSNKVAEVEALGVVVKDENKCVTNQIRIVREIPWSELLELVNSGLGNTGRSNSGDWNSGDGNSGDWNSGNWNSGNRNSGNWNSGDWNIGDSNSGNRNSGNRNSGNRNSGNWNSGNWNMTSNAVGCFNTEQQKLKFFDKETDMTFGQWLMSDAKYLLEQIDFRPTEWICSKDMTDEEEAAHPEHGTTGGYLKLCDRKVHCTEWWKGLSDEEKNIIRSIPNFDAKKFYKITGIRA